MRFNRLKKIISCTFVCGFMFFHFMLFFGLNGQAYIDPSVITYLIQVISGIVVSLGAFFGVYGRKIKKAIGNKLGLSENSHKIVESDDIKIW
ncbi:MAG: hypothetical protein ACI4D8_05010 [Wujia sp.]